MKRVWQLFKYPFIISIALIFCTSCGNDEPSIDNPKDPDPIEDQEEKIEYYVKYQSNVYIPSSRIHRVKVSVMTEKGMQTFDVPMTWEGVFGPFNDLTTLLISSNTTGYNQNTTHCRGSISICRGNQPFVLKADKSCDGTSYSVKYIVTKFDLK